jgi:hypothetical protein
MPMFTTAEIALAWQRLQAFAGRPTVGVLNDHQRGALTSLCSKELHDK